MFIFSIQCSLHIFAILLALRLFVAFILEYRRDTKILSIIIFIGIFPSCHAVSVHTNNENDFSFFSNSLQNQLHSENAMKYDSCKQLISTTTIRA